MSLHLSKCHIVGNHMSRPKCQNQSARLKCLVWHKHYNVLWHSKRHARYGLKDFRLRGVNRKLSQRKWPFLFSRVSLLVRDNLSPKAARTGELPFYNFKRFEQGFHTKIWVSKEPFLVSETLRSPNNRSHTRTPFTVKPVLRSHPKIDKTKVWEPCGILMQVKSTAECSGSNNFDLP